VRKKQLREAFRKNAARALIVVTKEPANGELERDRTASAGQISNGSLILAVGTFRGRRAQGTAGKNSDGSSDNDATVWLLDDLFNGKVGIQNKENPFHL